MTNLSKIIFDKTEYSVLILSILLSGCAKFDFFLGTSSSIIAFQIQTPTTGTALVPNTTFTITGVCDPLGGLVTITGTSMSEASVSGPCDPLLGTFSINATSMPNGELLDLQASQLDAQSSLLNSVVNSLMIHCAGAPMIACAISGSGNPVDQYLVGNISCLQEMRTGLSCHYALNNNIDASATSTWNPAGSDFLGWEPIPNNNLNASRFTGSLDGRGRTISNLYMTPRFDNGSGLFSRLQGTAAVAEHVYDLTLSNASLDLYSLDTPFGFIAGISVNANIRNVDIVNGNADFTSTFNRERVGMLFGEATSNNISDSQTSGQFIFNGSFDEANTKYGLVGGYVGYLINSTVTNGVSNVNMVTDPGNLSYFARLGGAFGELAGGSVSGFRTTSNIQLDHVGINAFGSVGIAGVGGFAGRVVSNTTITNLCINSNLDLSTTNLGIELAGGFSGYVGLAGTVNATNISVRGSVIADPTSNMLNLVSGFIGVDYGVSTYTNIMMDNAVQIVSGVSPNAFTGYGGLLADNSGGNSVSFNNVLGLSSHAISPGINTPGGLFYDVDFATLNSLFYKIGGGAPAAEGIGGPNPAITSLNQAGLSALANGSYTGFDFVTVWQRDGVTNLPELRFCP